jgi:DNA-3-methyladenine glycosylase I
MPRPENDDEYFERMNRAIFQAGLNWKIVENKWNNFQEAFSDFSIDKVAAFREREIESLMNNPGIVRNEKKISAAINNANEALKLRAAYGSFRAYFESFGSNPDKLLADLQKRFYHLGPSTARIFAMMVGEKLGPGEHQQCNRGQT